MKISKTAVLALGGVIATAGLGLMVVSAATDYEKGLFMNLDNAVQHFEKIKFITGSSDSVVYMKKGGSANVALVEIDANNFAMIQTGVNEKNIIEGGNGNSILGGIKNKIKGNYNVILGGTHNTIANGHERDVILGGSENDIKGSYSTIVGGYNNKVNSYFSTIIGNNNNANGKYSVVVGDNNTVGGTNSVALGSHATVNGANSFLWSDGSAATVGNGDVFAVNAASGMVVGEAKAHSFSKLTIGGSLVVLQKDLGTCNSSYQGVLKVKASSAAGRVCFCSCDGTTWNSLHGGGKCASVCDASRLNPECNSAGAEITCEAGNVYTITNGCKKGQIVKGTGAFLIDKFDKIHWTCEEENGNTVICESANVPYCNIPVPGPECSTTTPNVCVWPANADKIELRKGPLNQQNLEDRWTWVCEYGSIKLDCVLPKVINGQCNNSVVNGCTAGTLNDTADTATQYKWQCVGINGTTDNCSKDMPKPECGSANGGSYDAKPTSNLCGTSSTASTVTEGTNSYTWTCTRGSSTVNCSATKVAPPIHVPAVASCGTANGGTYKTKPTSNLCDSSSTASTVTEGIDSYTWTCIRGSSTANCSASKVACGTANGSSYSTKPTSNLCVNGSTASTVTEGTNSYTWTCTKGSVSVSCSATRTLLPAECGTANGGSYDTKPTSNLCGTSSTASVVTEGTDSYTWTCTRGTASASCSATRLKASCGTSNGQSLSTKPTSNLCGTSSTASTVTEGTNSYTWTCTRGSSSVPCSATKVEASCGSANGGSYKTKPTSNLCGTSSTASTVTEGTDSYTWTCTRGSSVKNCSASKVACGTANGSSYSTKPTSNLCVNGSTASAVTEGTNSYTWTCTKGTVSVSCSATRTLLPAECGTSNGQSFSTKPTSNLCGTSSTASTVTEGTDSYTWVCTRGTSTTNCSATRLKASCGTANGGTYTSTPTSNLCGTSSTASTVTLNGNTYKWTCKRGSSTVDCSATKVAASCGSANGGSYSTKPASNLCDSSSTASTVTEGTDSYTWTCTRGSSSVPCSATRLKASCGTANGGTYTAKPTSNLCGISSTASTVTEEGNTYKWTCTRGSSSVPCSATKVEASCGSANGGSYSTKPTSNLCGTSSTASTVTEGTDSYTWTCTRGSSSVPCSATRLKASCGTANGGTYTAKPTTNLCGTSSTASAVTEGMNSYTWTCTRGSSSVPCSASRIISVQSAACGPIHTTTVSSKPASNLCSQGTSSSVTGGEPKYYWNCSVGTTKEYCWACASQSFYKQNCGQSGGTWDDKYCDCDCPDREQPDQDGYCPDNREQETKCSSNQLRIGADVVQYYQCPVGNYQCSCGVDNICCCTPNEPGTTCG